MANARRPEKKQSTPQPEFPIASSLFPAAAALDNLSQSITTYSSKSLVGGKVMSTSRQSQNLIRPASHNNYRTTVSSQAASRNSLQKTKANNINKDNTPQQRRQRAKTAIGTSGPFSLGSSSFTATNSLNASSTLSSFGKPVSSHQVRWWREFVWPQLGEDLQGEVKLVEQQVKSIIIEESSRNRKEKKNDTTLAQSSTAEGDMEDSEEEIAVSAEHITDKVFDISFRHLLRRDQQFHTALKHR